MKKIIHGLILISVGISILFPQVFKLISWDIFKYVLSLYLIWVGLTLVFKKGEKKIEKNLE